MSRSHSARTILPKVTITEEQKKRIINAFSDSMPLVSEFMPEETHQKTAKVLLTGEDMNTILQALRMMSDDTSLTYALRSKFAEVAHKVRAMVG